MKESYETLSLEVIKFEAADVIITSGPGVEEEYIGEEFGMN